MNIFRVLTHSLVWFMINIGSVIVAFLLGYLIEGKRTHHAGIQLLAGPLVSTLGILFWSLWTQRFLTKIHLFAAKEIVWVYGVSLVWGSVLFAGVHYLTQGYVTSLSNIIMLVVFQAWANLFAVIILSRRTPHEA